MQWSNDECLQLIDSYKNESIIWDPKHSDHFKKNLREDAWRDICLAVGRSADDCKAKMTNLLCSYRREKGKVKRGKTTGEGTSEIYTSRWFAWEALRFLEDRDEPRKRINTDDLEEVVINEEVESVASPQSPKGQRAESSEFSTPRAKRAKGKAEKPAEQPHDENTTFFKYNAAKVDKYSEETRRGVHAGIFGILTKADQGFYEFSRYTYYSGYQQYPQPNYIQPSPSNYHQTPNRAFNVTQTDSTSSSFTVPSPSQESNQSAADHFTC